MDTHTLDDMDKKVMYQTPIKNTRREPRIIIQFWIWMKPSLVDTFIRSDKKSYPTTPTPRD